MMLLQQLMLRFYVVYVRLFVNHGRVQGHNHPHHPGRLPPVTYLLGHTPPATYIPKTSLPRPLPSGYMMLAQTSDIYVYVQDVRLNGGNKLKSLYIESHLLEYGGKIVCSI